MTAHRAGVRPAPLRLPGAGAGRARPGRHPDHAVRAGRLRRRRRQPDRRAWGWTPTAAPTGRAFVDAVGWLEERGALRLADGSTRGWAGDPGAGEALYDIARDVVLAVFRPPRVLQHVDSVAALLGHDRRSQAATAGAAHGRRRRARRALVEHAGGATTPRSTRGCANHAARARLWPRTSRGSPGWRVERRAEGVRWSTPPALSPSAASRHGGTVAQAALLLLGEMADRVVDPDAAASARLPAPRRPSARDALVDRDRRRPARRRASSSGLADEPSAEPGGRARAGPERAAGTRWSATAGCAAPCDELVERYAKAFGAEWQADPDGCARRRVDLLARTGSSSRSPGGVLVLPAGRPLPQRARSGSSAAHRPCSTSMPRSHDHRPTVAMSDPHGTRFRPTRAGIINLWDYRDEEFVFVDGRLVLRGPERLGQDQGPGGAVPVRAGRADRAAPAQPVRLRGPHDEVQPALPRAGAALRATCGWSSATDDTARRSRSASGCRPAGTPTRSSAGTSWSTGGSASTSRCSTPTTAR